MLKHLVRLVWPLNCPGCGEYDVHLCSKCEEVMKTSIFRLIEDRESSRPVYAAFSYTSSVRA
ncbi:MAG: hypothetical protein LBP35_01985 [Candidatus Ancillula trichonymphae]|nr:hypothetical protein [Candidatus Ancillula trichonymphae]